MAERRRLQGLIINNVVRGDVIGKGASGKITKGTWEGAPCAIKEIHSIFVEIASDEEFKAFKSAFVEECCRSSQLRHPNIVQFLGVYFTSEGHSSQYGLPCLVMELLHCDLTAFLKNNPVISYKIKLSILNDVALALRFLHSRSPSIIHRDLSSNNILISRGCKAKIGDLGTARFLNPKDEAQLSRMSQLSKAPGTVDFMSPEVLFDNPQYGTPLDVFSFACVSLHAITHQWPSPTAPMYTDTRTNRLLARSEVERRSSFFNEFGMEALPLKSLLMHCLSNDPKARPTIVEICDSLLQLKGPEFQPPMPNFTGKAKDLPSDMQNATAAKQHSLSEDNVTVYWSKLKKVWGSCANLPRKMEVLGDVTIVDGKIYVTDNFQVYCYHVDQDTWSKLPTPPVRNYSLVCVPATKHLLAIGGLAERISNQVLVWKETTRCWDDTVITSRMQVARMLATAVGYRSLVIILGGLIDKIQQSTTQTVEVLDIASGNLQAAKWYTVQSMPYGAFSVMTTIISDQLFVAGGFILQCGMLHMTSVSIPSLLKSKDGKSSVWSDISYLPCTTLAFTSYKKYLLIFGGDHIVGAKGKWWIWKAISSIYMYHTEAKLWEKVGNIPSKNYLGPCVHLTCSKIMFIGGKSDPSTLSVSETVTDCLVLMLNDDTSDSRTAEYKSSKKGDTILATDTAAQTSVRCRQQ